MPFERRRFSSFRQKILGMCDDDVFFFFVFLFCFVLFCFFGFLCFVLFRFVLFFVLVMKGNYYFRPNIHKKFQCTAPISLN